MLTLRIVLRLSQRSHHIHPARLPRELLYLRIIKSHKHVVLLLVANRKFSLSFLVGCGKRFKLLDRFRLYHLDTKLHITLGILVTRVDLRVIWQRRESLVQCRIHFLGCTFKESPTASNEESVSCEDCLVVAVFEEIADAVLRVTWRVEGLDCDARPDGECLAVSRCLGDLVAVLATNDRQWVALQDLLVPSGMIVMAV